MHKKIVRFRCSENTRRMILLLQLRGRKTHPLVGVKDFFEDEG